MRLLAVTDASGFGGAELFLASLVGALDRGIDVTVAGPDRDTTVLIAGRRPGTRALGVVDGDVRSHLGLIARTRPDVVQVNAPHPYAAFAPLLAALLSPGVRTVLVDHLPQDKGHPRRVVLPRRLLDRRVDAHVAVGREAARILEATVGLAAGSVEAIANGVPPFEAPGVPPTDALPPGPRIGGVGRLTRQKGFDLLVGVLDRLPGAQLVLVGDGPERAALEAQAADLGVADRLHVTGWTDRPRDWVAGLDVFVLPSREEGMPLAILEAMQAGVPVVTADVGSSAEPVLAAGCGIVVPPESPDALLDALLRLLDDPAATRAMGAAGAVVGAAEYSDVAMARRYEALYQRLVV